MKKLTVSKILFIILLATAGTFAQKVDKTAKVGAGIYEIVFNEKENAVYVAATGKRGEKGTAKIYKLDPQTLEVKSTIDVSEAPAYGLGLNSKTQTLYSSNTNSNSVHAIDLKTGKVLATINSGKEKSHTREVVVDEANNKIYVTNMTDVWVIDGATNKFESLIEGVGAGVTGITLNAPKQILYITNMGDQTNPGGITAYDLKAKKVINTFESGGKSPINACYDAAGKRLFVANQGDGKVTVLDESGKLLQTIPTGAGALGINYNPAKNLIYVANRGTGTTSVIDGKTYKVIADLKTGSSPQTIAIDKKSGRVFVTNKTAPRRRPAPGETAPATPPAEDPNGDVVTVINP